jgi:hypothetical protein
MATGHTERLSSGRLRVVVYAGKDPITGRKIYLKETRHGGSGRRGQEPDALPGRGRADPERSATLADLLVRGSEVVDHELTTEIYTRRVLVPALGDVPLRKLQHRVDMIHRLYTRLRRCSALCDGRPFVEHTRTGLGRGSSSPAALSD